MSDRAVVLLSGGLDSTTVAATARSQGYEIHALSFDYKQRHRIELKSAKVVADHLRVASHRIIEMPNVGGSALTDQTIDVPKTGLVDATSGVVMDFADITEAVKPIIDRLDHYYLNEIEGLANPTSEILARWLFKRIENHLPGLVSIEVRETCTSGVIYRGD
jgi:6-pyruvoyltetrahydropterin/6-carboxytetrahydropterin synthase